MINFSNLFTKVIKESTASKLLYRIINILLVFIIIYYTLEFIWLCSHIDISLKNYIEYFLWNISIWFSIPSDLESFYKNIKLEIGHMILLGDFFNYWTNEVFWNLWIINTYKENNRFLYDDQQVELILLHITNNFLFKVEEFFSFSSILVLIFFYKFFNQINTYKNNSPFYNIKQICFCIFIDLVFFILLPIIILLDMFNLALNITKYFYIRTQNIKKIIVIYQFSKLMPIISQINWKKFKEKKLTYFFEKLLINFKIEFAYFYTNIFIKSFNTINRIVQVKTKFLKMIENTKNLQIYNISNSVIFYNYILLRSLIFYFIRLLQYIYIYLGLTIKFLFLDNILKQTNKSTMLLKFVFIFKNKFILWRPLFKRWSYLGLFFKTRTFWVRFTQLNELYKTNL